MTATSRLDWIRTGLSILRDEGEQALTVQRLCHELERTKGSFYHHFENLDHFVAALLEHWENRYTGGIIEATSFDGPAAARLHALFEATQHSVDHRLERAVRLWAPRRPQVSRVVQRVDGRRLAYLEALFIKLPACTDDASSRARLCYATLVGEQMLFLDLESTARDAVGSLLQRCLLPNQQQPHGGEDEEP